MLNKPFLKIIAGIENRNAEKEQNNPGIKEN